MPQAAWAVFSQTCFNKKIRGILPCSLLWHRAHPTTCFSPLYSSAIPKVVPLWNKTSHFAEISIKIHGIRAPARSLKARWHAHPARHRYSLPAGEEREFKKEGVEWGRYLQFGLSTPKMTQYTCMPHQWNRAHWLDFYHFISSVWQDVTTPLLLWIRPVSSCLIYGGSFYTWCRNANRTVYLTIKLLRVWNFQYPRHRSVGASATQGIIKTKPKW